MIPDSNSLVEFTSNYLSSMVSGDLTLLFIILVMLVAVMLVFARAKASTVLASIFGLTFLFMVIGLGVSWLFWIMIIIAVFVLVMGFRKQNTQ